MDPNQAFERSLAMKIKSALPFRRSFCEFVFHLGYQGVELPRMVRRVFARTDFHRAWLGGFSGLAVLSILELTELPKDCDRF